MIDARLFDDLAARLETLLPPGAKQAREDFSKNARATLQGALGGLDLVTREEFDVQAAVLGRTREKLEALEARVAALEGGTAGADPGRAAAADAPAGEVSDPTDDLGSAPAPG